VLDAAAERQPDRLDVLEEGPIGQAGQPVEDRLGRLVLAGAAQQRPAVGKRLGATERASSLRAASSSASIGPAERPPARRASTTGSSSPAASCSRNSSTRGSTGAPRPSDPTS
jgi:hypothetical protein